MTPKPGQGSSHPGGGMLDRQFSFCIVEKMSWTPLTHKKERFEYPLLLWGREVVVEFRYTHTHSQLRPPRSGRGELLSRLSSKSPLFLLFPTYSLSPPEKKKTPVETTTPFHPIFLDRAKEFAKFLLLLVSFARQLGFITDRTKEKEENSCEI